MINFLKVYIDSVLNILIIEEFEVYLCVSNEYFFVSFFNLILNLSSNL